jgi:hypothetical protein
VNGFIEHLYTPLGTTSNYSAIANLHALEIATAPAKKEPVLLAEKPLCSFGIQDKGLSRNPNTKHNPQYSSDLILCF